jgi:hypothetical protein
MMTREARRRESQNEFGDLARLRSPTEIQKTVTFHRASPYQKEIFLWEEAIIPTRKCCLSSILSDFRF